jgi:hypothetical protein
MVGYRSKHIDEYIINVEVHLLIICIFWIFRYVHSVIFSELIRKCKILHILKYLYYQTVLDSQS